MVNTRINYLYRDSSNYKVQNQAVVAGKLTDADKQTIISCLDEGQYFIPHMVGLQEKRFEKTSDTDHSWFELCITDIEGTDDPATVDMTAAELVQRFKTCKGCWDKGVHDMNNPTICPFCGGVLSYQERFKSNRNRKCRWECQSCRKIGFAVFDVVEETTFSHHECCEMTQCEPTPDPVKQTESDSVRTIWVEPSCFVPEFKMTIAIPNDRDAEEYIDEFLEGILNEDLVLNCEWNFV